MSAGVTLEQILARSMTSSSSRRAASKYAAVFGDPTSSRLEVPTASPPVSPQLANGTPPPPTPRATSTALGRTKGHSTEDDFTAPTLVPSRPVRPLRNASDVTAVLQVSREIGDWATAFALFQQCATREHYVLQPKALDLLAQVSVEEGQIVPLTSMLEKLYGTSAGAADVSVPFSTVVDALGRAGRWQEATQLLSSAAPHHLTDSAFAAAILCCGPSGRWDTAMGVFGMGRQRVTGGGGETARGNTTADCASSVQEPLASASNGSTLSAAALLSTLEACGRRLERDALLQSMPALDRGAVQASYAAMVQLWSKRQERTMSRRF